MRTLRHRTGVPAVVSVMLEDTSRVQTAVSLVNASTHTDIAVDQGPDKMEGLSTNNEVGGLQTGMASDCGDAPMTNVSSQMARNRPLEPIVNTSRQKEVIDNQISRPIMNTSTQGDLGREPSPTGLLMKASNQGHPARKPISAGLMMNDSSQEELAKKPNLTGLFMNASKQDEFVGDPRPGPLMTNLAKAVPSAKSSKTMMDMNFQRFEVSGERRSGFLNRVSRP